MERSHRGSCYQDGCVLGAHHIKPFHMDRDGVHFPGEPSVPGLRPIGPEDDTLPIRTQVGWERGA